MARTAKQTLATSALGEVFSSYVPIFAISGALDALDKMGAFHAIGLGGDPSKVNLVKQPWLGGGFADLLRAGKDPRFVAAGPLNAAFRRWSKGKRNEAAQRALLDEMLKFRAAGWSISPQVDEMVDGLAASSELPPVDVTPAAPGIEQAAPALWMDREGPPVTVRENLQPALVRTSSAGGKVKIVAPGALGPSESDGVGGAGLVLLLVAAVLLVLLAAG